MISHRHQPRRAPVVGPTEADEQKALARQLEAAGLVWWHTPNEGRRGRLEAVELERAGVRSGIPDVVILTPAGRAPRGVALELKRRPPAGKLGDVRPDQWLWLGRFQAAGFVALVALGADDAVSQLRALGYAVP